MPTKAATTTTPSTATFRVLLHALAYVDEANNPPRDWSNRAAGANRAAIRERGAPYQGGGDAAARQRSHRAVADAADAGLILVTAGRGERGGLLKVTDRGERIARSLIDYPTAARGLRLLRRVAHLEAHHVGWGVGYGHGTENTGPAWANETTIAGIDPAANYTATATEEGRQLLVDVQLDSLPALFRHWLAAGSDVRGRAWFSITAAGRRALEAEGDASPAGESLPQFSQAAQDYYHKQRLAARRLIATSRSLAAANEIGDIPLSCSIAPLREATP